MDHLFPQDSSTQRKKPRSVTMSSKANSINQDPFADRSAHSSQPATGSSSSESSQHLPRPDSVLSTSTAPGRHDFLPGRPKYFHSRRIRKDEVIKPWVKESRDSVEKWIEVIPLIGLLVGAGIAGVLIWNGLSNVIDHNYCPVLTEDWSNGFRPEIWQPEIQVGGFGYVVSSPWVPISHSLSTADMVFFPQQRRVRTDNRLPREHLCQGWEPIPQGNPPR